MIFAEELFFLVSWQNKGVLAMITYSLYCESISGSYQNIRHRLSSRLICYSKEWLERLVGLNKINKIYERVAGSEDGIGFLRKVSEELNIRYEIDDEDLANIPKAGPVLVVANHPFGGIEGIVLARIMHEKCLK
jgi:putative hemolysin